jgi:hypothetical protein
MVFQLALFPLNYFYSLRVLSKTYFKESLVYLGIATVLIHMFVDKQAKL